jgi:preprotein translocase subunit SecA
MGQIYHFLGLKIGCITQSGSFIYDPEYVTEEEVDENRDEMGSFKVFQEFLKPCTRKEAYLADITYGTSSEFGFDYLRDHLVGSKAEMSQRGHYFAIIDEIDSILIDEARTPLIISQQDSDSSSLYKQFSMIAPKLKESDDFEVDYKQKSVTLLEGGLNKLENMLGVDIFNKEGVIYVHHLEEALKAEFLFKKDKDYIVKDGNIYIVDEFTGRVLPDRRYSGGLHQAIEAKESVNIKPESKTVATVTLQNYFRMYDFLAGMTGTALSSGEEFNKVYSLRAVSIPTNKTIIRKDLPDKIYQNDEAKYRAIVRTVKEKNEKGQPVLIGTRSVEINEIISRYLSREGVNHNLLNAKQHEREGEIIAQAGKSGAVTVATNMAGRGVDIILGGNPLVEEEREKVLKAGGLCVIGTERHEARRIDDQLRGRAGRQGDVGETQFFVSLSDELIKIFAPKNIQMVMGRLGLDEDEAIEHPMISRAIEKAQGKIEGINFDLRKHVLEYDDVLDKQRKAVYRRRINILDFSNKEILDYVIKTGETQIRNFNYTLDNLKIIESMFGVECKKYVEEHINDLDNVKAYLIDKFNLILKEKEAKFEEGLFVKILRQIMLNTIDSL